jgi:hypothetical protein
VPEVNPTYEVPYILHLVTSVGSPE